jgi:hexosaminidase
MRLITFVPIFATLAAALWPVPVTYEHGDCILFIREDVAFNWYEAGARNVGSIADQHPDQFIFSNSDTAHDAQDSLILRKRYTTPRLESEVYNSSKKEVSGEDIIDHAIKSTWTTIFKQNFYPWKLHPRVWSSPSPSNERTISEINIYVLSPSSNISAPFATDIDESYSLTLTTSGIATITANTSIGISHGLTTFSQLFYSNSDNTYVYTPLAPIYITDFPKFPHRGINLDLARAFISVADIKRQIDALAYNKMNRLHLHITDSQSWPLVIPTLPELAAKGAYRPDLIYTVEDFDDVQRYAALHGVEVITEIDMPGHTASIAYAYPELIAAFDIQPNWDTYAAEPPSGTLKLNSSAVSSFLDKLFDDVLPRVLPYSKYFHTGGDEVNKMAYTLDDTVKSSDVRVLQPLMQQFVEKNHERVRKNLLTPVVWEEMLLEWNATLGKDVVVQSWQSDEAVRQIVEKGYRVLVGNYNYWVSRRHLFLW